MDSRAVNTVGIIIITAIIVGFVVGAVVYVATPKEEKVTRPGEVTKSDVKDWIGEASEDTLRDIMGGVDPDILASVSTKPRHMVIGYPQPFAITGESWGQMTVKNMERIEGRLPNVDTVLMEKVKKEDWLSVCEEMIRKDGVDMFFGITEFVGLEYKKINEDYPDVYFSALIVGDTTTERNFIRVFPAEYQSMYLAGMVAGALTETDRIGMVGAYACAQNYRRYSAWALGAMEVNPDVEPVVLYTGSWFDPPTATEVTKTLIDDYNVDVVMSGTDSPSPAPVCKDEGVWFIGKDIDYVAKGWGDEDTVATSFVVNYEPILMPMIGEWMMGVRYPEPIRFYGMEKHYTNPEGKKFYTTDLSFNDKLGVPEGINPKARELISSEEMELIKERRDGLISGRWSPFKPEIRDLEGNIRFEEGEIPTQKELLEMDFYVEGMIVPE